MVHLDGTIQAFGQSHKPEPRLPIGAPMVQVDRDPTLTIGDVFYLNGTKDLFGHSYERWNFG